jgi:osmotically-inducible protein OsmY
MRKFVRFIQIAALGAVTEYFIDPNRGRARRVHAKEMVGGVFRRSRRHLIRGLRHVEGVAYGVYQRAHHLRMDEPADDIALVDRVKSEIFTNLNIPKADLTMEAQEGVVTLRGQVEDGDHIRLIEAAVRGVPGVKGVRSLLHLPGSPAPNKTAALSAR